jgi:tRNA(Ile2) C34 agmatinyltransferase TiaS
MNPVPDRPDCPKCRKPMRLVATGRFSRVFSCAACGEKVSVERDTPEEVMPAASTGGEE